MKKHDRFVDWNIRLFRRVPTKYNWVVQNVDGLILGNKTDIGAAYINAKYGVVIDDNVQIGSFALFIVYLQSIIPTVKLS